MFDNKTLKVQSTRETLFPRLKCVCVCVCACVCARVRARCAPKQTGKIHFELRPRPNDQIHTQYVKTDDLESIHLKHSLYLQVNENSREKIVCQYFVLVTDWSFFNVNQRTKHRKSLTALNLNKVITLISINLSIHTVKTMQCSFIFDHF